MSPLISIIIPVYNCANFIGQCIDSVLHQSFLDYELIIIDDGSTDGSGLICDVYAKKIDKIHVKHKKNSGVSSARNTGLDMAKGQWIVFIDADDYISQGYFDDIVNYKEDILVKNAMTLKLGKLLCFQPVLPEGVFVKNDSLSSFYNQYLSYFKAPWGKFYKKELIGNLRFNPNMKIGEDATFVFHYLQNCNSLRVSSNSTYIWRACDFEVKKYEISTQYAIASLMNIFKEFVLLSEKLQINHRSFFPILNYFKMLSKADWKREPISWYGNENIKQIYQYMLPSLSFRQKAVLLFKFLIYES